MKQQSQNKYQLSLNDLHDRIMLQTELGDHCDKIQQSSVGAQRYCQLIYTNIILIKTKLYLSLMFRSLSETFIRRGCWVLLPVLATVEMRRGKKSVMHVAWCIAALIPVHRTPFLLSNVNCSLNPSSRPISIRLPVQDCRFWLVYYMVGMACMISHS